MEELKERLEKIKNKISELKSLLDIEGRQKDIERINLTISKPGFWQDTEGSNRLIQELKRLKQQISGWQKSYEKCKEIEESISLAESEEEFNLLREEMDKIEKDIKMIELACLLCSEFDKNSAILSINSGAGGTEACDWAGMLLRMYSRWSEDKGYKIRMIDILPAEEKGIRNVTLLIEGDYAYGYLKAENGVHRLVRISPFDANKRRHTSFASVDVIPDIESDMEIKIEEKDLQIETFRASGPGGQHMQKTDSAVRIKHIPSGIVVQSQNERSQYQNKQTALKILKARLFERQREEREERLKKLYAKKEKIEWGSQIRSYILHPYNMVKDHRTDLETFDVQRVLDGDIDMFVEAYLREKPETRDQKPEK